MAGLLARVMNRFKIRKPEDGKEFLKKVIILSELTDDEFERVWSIVRRIDIPAGRIIMKEGEIGDSMYFFAQGIADVTKNLTMQLGKSEFGSVEKSMVKLDSRYVSFFGDMAMFEEEPRSATITASTPCFLYEIKRRDFESLCNENPVLGIKILRSVAAALCKRLRKGNQDVLKLSTALSVALSK